MLLAVIGGVYTAAILLVVGLCKSARRADDDIDRIYERHKCSER